MKPEYLEIPLVKNEELLQFEITVEGHKAFIVYKERPHTITLIHTETEPELEGKGTATAVIEKTLAYVEENNFKLIPLCPLVFAYIKRHPEWKRIVDENFKGFDE
ncbi:acetyltransferase [Flavobacterium limnosediminis JC2902]|uniref:Acetyltransferase n=1 Tax=Flavobacterium limnosediminis JC2902 TaxID=1341181 RepID=V6SFE1_9FLAO|nr:GNAT family N-acetyltransferase [Flavobacterium limnosediminis]ESU25291.1 acetyltransferase [Flavobacterium limnosediminis JC2902]